MLVREGDARNFDTDRRLAATLAAVAGALNTAAFQAVGFFSANMTGNVSLLSSRAAQLDFPAACWFGGLIATFVAGAMLSTLTINIGRRRGVRGVYALCILIEAVLLAILGCTELWLPAAPPGETLILGLSFLMGLQNAVVTRISDARVRTTHVSGMITDIGIGLGLLIDAAARRERPVEHRQTVARLRLHGETVLAFLGGGVVGVVLYHSVGNLLWLIAAAALFAIAARALMRVMHATSPV